MNWNHRIFKEGEVYSIREAYYEDGKVVSWTEAEPVTGEDVEDLKKYYEYMSEAFKGPVIEVDGDNILDKN